ncbi:MAG: helicase-associated domain-containing protein [Treponema sp.]
MQNRENEKTERIVQWREAFSMMQDVRFFEIMRAYLGGIRTPFNKHKLIEQLSSVLRNAENRENIRAFISEFDIKIITAVSFIENPSPEKLTELFACEYGVSEIHAELMNLCDRLIIYLYSKQDGTKIFRLNPLLDDVLLPFIDVNALLPIYTYTIAENDTPHIISPIFIGSFISFVKMFPDMCKNNSEIKKKDYERLKDVFPSKEKCAELLLKALINFGIFKYGRKGLFADEEKLFTFANLPEFEQYSYLAVCAAVRFGRENLRVHAQLLSDTLASIPAEGFSKAVILRAMFLLSNRKDTEEVKTVHNRFDRILSLHSENNAEPVKSPEILEEIVDAAIEFGLLSKRGITESGEEIFTASKVMQKSGAADIGNSVKKNALVIDAGNSITIMPTLNLKDVLTISAFADIMRCGTAGVFEITKKSVSRAFDKNLSPENIYSVLENFSAHEIPQSLKINIEEWHTSYSGALLYSGYVLKIDEKTRRIIEKSPAFTELVCCKLADGIFLLDIPDGEDPLKLISNSGIQITAEIITAKTREERVALPRIIYGNNKIGRDKRKNHLMLPDKSICEEKINALLKIADTLQLNAEERECLISRIKQKLIINKAQLDSSCLHTEILEADGTEYFSKLRLLEDSLNRDTVKIAIPTDNTGNSIQTFTGKVLELTRLGNDAEVKIEIEPNKETLSFSVSKISRVKIIRGFGIYGK